MNKQINKIRTKKKKKKKKKGPRVLEERSHSTVEKSNNRDGLSIRGLFVPPCTIDVAVDSCQSPLANQATPASCRYRTTTHRTAHQANSPGNTQCLQSFTPGMAVANRSFHSYSIGQTGCDYNKMAKSSLLSPSVRPSIHPSIHPYISQLTTNDEDDNLSHLASFWPLPSFLPWPPLSH